VKMFYGYGEEKFCKEIGRRIEADGEEEGIERRLEVVEIIKEGIGGKGGRKGGHAAKRILEGIRIGVKDEVCGFED
ncbi:16S rRNA (cytosine(1402)-N(4))-methyltransferase, partial [Staphylococcus hominis]|uniref:16S rRNA (cytosine(1402)-N(4))-methyltransferase n=1 Tax=Staphylococcus hominis TaxID=1290 RepID=UPI0011A4A03B